VKCVDQLVFGITGMDRDPLDVNRGFVGGEGLENDLAQVATVQRIGDRGLQIGRQIGGWMKQQRDSA